MEYLGCFKKALAVSFSKPHYRCLLPVLSKSPQWCIPPWPVQYTCPRSIPRRLLFLRFPSTPERKAEGKMSPEMDSSSPRSFFIFSPHFLVASFLLFGLLNAMFTFPNSQLMASKQVHDFCLIIAFIWRSTPPLPPFKHSTDEGLITTIILPRFSSGTLTIAPVHE